jgi:hypothetical protein
MRLMPLHSARRWQSPVFPMTPAIELYNVYEWKSQQNKHGFKNTDQDKVTIMERKYAQKGAAIVEFVIILPVFLIVFGLIVEFGMYFYDKALITNATMVAARAGIVYQEDCSKKLTNAEIKRVAICYLAVAEDYEKCKKSEPGVRFKLMPNSSTPPTVDDVTFPDPTDRCVSGNKLTVQFTWPYHTFILGQLFHLLDRDITEVWPITATTVMYHL